MQKKLDREKLFQLLTKQYTVHLEKKSELLLTVHPKNKDGTTNLDLGFQLESLDDAFYLYELQRNQAYDNRRDGSFDSVAYN